MPKISLKSQLELKDLRELFNGSFTLIDHSQTEWSFDLGGDLAGTHVSLFGSGFNTDGTGPVTGTVARVTVTLADGTGRTYGDLKIPAAAVSKGLHLLPEDGGAHGRDVAGGAGDDNLAGGAGDDHVHGGRGADHLRGGGGHDSLDGGAGNDSLEGGTGDDSLSGAAGDDSLDGGAGTDTARFDDAAKAVSVDLATGRATGDGSDTLKGIEDVVGSRHDDRLGGDSGRNDLSGGDGRDVAHGGRGDDSLHGDAGNDTLSGDAGNDRLDGGTGDDTADFSGAATGVSADLARGTATGEGSDTLVSIENLTGSRGNDDLSGSGGANRIEGGRGDDRLSGGGGGDALRGGDGRDTLDGGAGDDVLTGGGGSDSFVFHLAPGAGGVDRILDFRHGQDTIALDHAAFAAIGEAGPLAAEAFFLGAAAHAATDRILYDAKTGALSYDADGNGSGAAVQFATLAPHLTLTADDFHIV